MCYIKIPKYNFHIIKETQLYSLINMIENLLIPNWLCKQNGWKSKREIKLSCKYNI